MPIWYRFQGLSNLLRQERIFLHTKHSKNAGATCSGIFYKKHINNLPDTAILKALYIYTEKILKTSSSQYFTSMLFRVTIFPVHNVQL